MKNEKKLDGIISKDFTVFLKQNTKNYLRSKNMPVLSVKDMKVNLLRDFMSTTTTRLWKFEDYSVDFVIRDSSGDILIQTYSEQQQNILNDLGEDG